MNADSKRRRSIDGGRLCASVERIKQEVVAKKGGKLERAWLTPAPTHIEVYRNDPRRTRPAGLKTALLRELAAH
jgi:hypothetical protein